MTYDYMIITACFYTAGKRDGDFTDAGGANVTGTEGKCLWRSRFSYQLTSFLFSRIVPFLIFTINSTHWIP